VHFPGNLTLDSESSVNFTSEIPILKILTTLFFRKYYRWKMQWKNVHSGLNGLIFSKNRVPSLKTSIPYFMRRCSLLADHQQFSKSFTHKMHLYLWTDFSIVLAWLHLVAHGLHLPTALENNQPIYGISIMLAVILLISSLEVCLRLH